MEVDREALARQITEDYRSSLRDNDKLRAFFNRYNHLSISDITQALGIQRSHLYRLRKKIGLVVPSSFRVKEGKKYDEGPIDLPENWREKDVFLEFYFRFGPKRMAEATGKSLSHLWHMKIKYHPKPFYLHPYDNREWCYQNYILGDLSQKECAKRAGVSLATFNSWLCKHDIDRKFFENYAVPLYIKELANNLLKQPIVRNVKFKNGYLRVSYRSNVIERYFYSKRRMHVHPKAFKIKPEDTKIENDYGVQYIYDVGMDGENHYPWHFRMHKNYANFSLIEKRLACNAFLKKIFDSKWTKLQHPQDMIEWDLERCKNINTDRYWTRDGELRSYSNYGNTYEPGSFIAEHFFVHTYGFLIYCNTYAHERWRILKRLTRKYDDVTISSFLRYITANDKNITLESFDRRIKFHKDFGSSLAILRKFNIQGSVLDLSPGYGYNALASAVHGLKYYTLEKHKKVNRMISEGFSDFTGLDHEVWNGQQVDCLLYHNYYFPSEPVLQRYYKYAKRIIVYVPNSSYERWAKEFKPKMVVKYLKRSPGKDCDYLMIW